jgi:phage tail protein X
MKTVSIRCLAAALVVLLTAPLAAAAEKPFENWAGIFVAADYRAHSGAVSDVFDNGRRDVAKAFIDAGLKRENTIQFSVRADHYENTPEKPFFATPRALREEIAKVTDKAKGGCVFFLTSHGSPEAVVLGDYFMAPAALARMLDSTCGTRPSVVIVSACFSGIFVPALAAPNRVVLTAARHDRSSFGCGESDVYTFFDTCILEELPQAGRLDVLGQRLRSCVEKRETAMGMRPPSEPQMAIGATMQASLDSFALARSYKVKEGDTLAKISQEMYGQANRAEAIFEANRPALRSPAAALPPGQTLKIPPV